MARTISSPGVELFEKDLSLRTPQSIGTNIFIPGFANQGPSDEVIRITSQEELDNIYGTPTNSSERYFYYSVKELLNSPASIYTFRIPYGAGSGDGFGSQYSALVYPVKTFVPSTSAVTDVLNLSAATYALGQPVHVNLTEEEYRQAAEGTLFDWSTTASPTDALSSTSSLGGAGVIILDKAQTSVNSQFEGYYVGLADNTINPASNYNNIGSVKSLSLTSNYVGTTGKTYTTVPNGTLQFNLTSTSGNSGSISEIMETLTDYDIDGRENDDTLNVGVFKLRKSIYATEAFKLDYVLDDSVVGSIDTFREQLNPTGPSIPFFLETRDENTRNIEILVNPYISNKFDESSLNSSGVPQKKIRVLTSNLSSEPYSVTQIALSSVNSIANDIGYADNLYPLGSYSTNSIKKKLIGNVPTKVERALDSVKNDEIYDIDVVAEGGLGTIFTMSSAAGTHYYDETLYNSTLKTKVDSLRTSNDISGDANATAIRANYSAVFNKFENFCNLPSRTGGRGDCVFIADPIRHILVTGRNNKILADKSNNFQTDVYWPIRHQFELENTSYGITYGNWVQVFDDFTGQKVWSPFSGHAAAVFARNDAQEFKWSAPAGYTRGLLTTSALDLAITPNQKQRDEFYKSNINPVLFSPVQGMVVFGQKTLLRKPSAFDRINVRRLFLALERPTKKAAQFFVFEPNNEFTRTRIINTLTPIFEFAKQNGGLYDYLIVSDDRNNTPQIIDNNELIVDVYLKPTRTAEYIQVNFIATRTGANLEEIIG